MDSDSSVSARPIQFAVALALALAVFSACGTTAGSYLPTPTLAQARSAPPSGSAASSVTTAEPTQTATPMASQQKTLAPTPSPATPAPTAKPAPTTKPAPTPVQTQNLCGAPANPWGYNFCSGSFITSPAATICNYINCIANFWNGRGYVMQCSDTAFGKSGGISGSCSSHGGNFRALRAP
jgi:hypothetical protein